MTHCQNVCSLFYCEYFLFFLLQVFYPKDSFNNPLVLDLIFKQVTSDIVELMQFGWMDITSTDKSPFFFTSQQLCSIFVRDNRKIRQTKLNYF